MTRSVAKEILTPIYGVSGPVAESLARLLDPGIPDPGPADHATLLAMGQAALLSARTGQAESPATIKHMVGAA